MLEQEPSSGYDLLKHFRESLGYFWNAKHQQIYHQLKKLSEDGLINCENAEQSGKPDKKVYRISREGKAELQNWLAEAVEPAKINDALLVKLYGTEAGDTEVVFEELQRHVSLHEHILEKLRGIEKKYHALPPKQQEAQRFPYITLRRGIIGEEAWLQWAKEAIQLFKK